MKKRDMQTLALLGLASGLLVTSQAETIEISEIDQHILAAAENKHKCPGKAGCPGAKRVWPSGLIADNDATGKSPYQSPSGKQEEDPNYGNMGYHLMTEDELMLELNDEGSKQYKSLGKEGKELALKVASMRCNGTNECKGLNACETDKNKCAGKGSCKGQGKCAFSDKNLAVKVVYEKMKNKRLSAVK